MLLLERFELALPLFELEPTQSDLLLERVPPLGWDQALLPKNRAWIRNRSIARTIGGNKLILVLENAVWIGHTRRTRDVAISIRARLHIPKVTALHDNNLLQSKTSLLRKGDSNTFRSLSAPLREISSLSGVRKRIEEPNNFDAVFCQAGRYFRGRIQMLRNRTGLPWACSLSGPFDTMGFLRPAPVPSESRQSS